MLGICVFQTLCTHTTSKLRLHYCYIDQVRGVYSIEVYGRCLCPGKKRGGNEGGRLHCLSTCTVFLLFSQKFLARYARSHFIFIFQIQLQVQTCNVTLPTPLIFYCTFGVIIPDNWLPKCTKTHVKSHRIAYKTSKKRVQLGLRQDPAGGANDAQPDVLVGWGYDKLPLCTRLSPHM